jgi:hypothetical protein
MMHGEQRDRARVIAFLYNANGTPYKKAYSDYLSKTSFKRATDTLAKVAFDFGKRIAEVAQSFRKFAEVINDR